VDHHGISMVGNLILQKIDSLPTYVYGEDEGRLVYVKSDNTIYKGSDSEWVKVIDFDSDYIIQKFDYFPTYNEGQIFYHIGNDTIYRGRNNEWVELIDHTSSRIVSKEPDLPEYNASRDDGRIIFNEDDENLYLGKDGGWFHMNIEEIITYTHPQGIQCIHSIADHDDSIGTTSARNNDSITLLLQAKALSDHNQSDDHNDKYYTKSEIDSIGISSQNFYTKTQSDDRYASIDHTHDGDTTISEDDYVRRDGSTTSGTIRRVSGPSYEFGFKNITISTDAPTSNDGIDGDVWFQIEE